MPQPGKAWQHVIFGTRGSWLPGDPRGWRSRGHKRHSSGDYRNPPPTGEHQGLYQYSKQHRPDAVVIPRDLRAAVGTAFLECLGGMGHRVIAMAIAGMHAHLLAELPKGPGGARSAVGSAKKASSRAIRSELPGRVWAAGGRYKIIDTPAYQRRIYEYILGHRNEDAWVWAIGEA